MTTTPWKVGLAAVAVLALAACGSDDSDETDATVASAAPGTASVSDGIAGEDHTAGGRVTDNDGLTAYCDAVLAIETTGEPAIDFETATPDEISAGLAEHRERLRPLADAVLAAAPAGIEADLEVMSDAIDMIGAVDGDPFEAPAVVVANQRIHAFDLANCGWQQIAVQASEYAFGGLPGNITAGPVSFDLTNTGAELHELLVARVNDGVTTSAVEIVTMPEEEAFQLITLLRATAFAPPGASDYVVFDLEPGRYIAACFVPEGATPDGPPPQGPPHALHGMYAEFTVT